MNSNRALALPWNIYSDQGDSLAQISPGWIQAYAEDAQKHLDMILHAYAIAEHLPPCRTALPDSAGRTSTRDHIAGKPQASPPRTGLNLSPQGKILYRPAANQLRIT